MEPQQPAPDPLTEAALRSLKDIALPPPVSWMPQTWGWVLLATVLLVVAGVTVLVWWRRFEANAYRREALGQLVLIERRIKDPVTRQDAVHELALVLKRVALASSGRSETASLSGASWVRFIDSRTENGAGQALGKMLDDGEYHGEDDAGSLYTDEGADLIADARRWIEQHHVSV